MKPLGSYKTKALVLALAVSTTPAFAQTGQWTPVGSEVVSVKFGSCAGRKQRVVQCDAGTFGAEIRIADSAEVNAFEGIGWGQGDVISITGSTANLEGQGFCGGDFFQDVTAEIWRCEPTGPPPPPPTSCVAAPPGLVGWWPGDGNANDIAGGQHGVLNKGVSFVPGVVGQALDFDGVDDHVELPPSSTNFGGGVATIDFWFRTTAALGSMFDMTDGTPDRDNAALICLGNCTSTVVGESITLASRSGGAQDYKLGIMTQPLNDGQWHHLAVVYEGAGGLVRGYVDGIERAVQVGIPPVNPGTYGTFTAAATTAYIGGEYFQGFYNPFAGSIDEFEIHDYAFSAEEVAVIYAAGSFGKCKISADAGTDQTVDENDFVTLDGTASAPTGAVTFSWSQLAGPSVALDTNLPAQPTFTAPYVPATETLTFELVVNDGVVDSEPDTVDITVVDINSPPAADAGDDSTIKEGAVATLTGSHSYDPDGDALTYSWQQVDGPAVTLSPDSTAESPTFIAPTSAGATLVFKLQVSDGKEASTPSSGTDSSFDDTVAVWVVLNSPPTADAGDDQTRGEGSTVALDGLGSSDPDGGDTLSYAWTQLGGEPVALSDGTTPMPTFAAPAVPPGGVELDFALVVTDDDPVNPLSSGPDVVTIHVTNVNDPPRCDLATPSIALLWPPNHKMIPVTIEGVTDSDATYGDVSVEIVSVTQDEPVNGLGDGDSSPDAIVQSFSSGDTVLVRAERSGVGNGRVYVITFVADDGFESCQGTVAVGVPHHRKSSPIDDGQTHDATIP